MKKFLIILGAIIVCGGIGLMIPRLMNDGTGGIEVDVTALQKNFETEVQAQLEQQIEEASLRSQLEQEYDEMLLQQRQEQMLMQKEALEDEAPADAISQEAEIVDEAVDTVITEVVDESSTMTEEVVETVEEAPVVVETEEVVDSEEIPLTVEDLVLTEEEQYVKDQWVNDQINEHIGEIDHSDLQTGANIYNTLDTSYLFGLAADGLTQEEEEQVKDYLYANLSEEQIGIVLELYNKYIHLLD